MLRELLKIRRRFAVLMEMVDLKSVMWRKPNPAPPPRDAACGVDGDNDSTPKPNDGCEGNGMKTIVQQSVSFTSIVSKFFLTPNLN